MAAVSADANEYGNIGTASGFALSQHNQNIILNQILIIYNFKSNINNIQFQIKYNFFVYLLTRK